ncbi:unnamed protein product, partial [Closterium sp. Yama58-4]
GVVNSELKEIIPRFSEGGRSKATSTSSCCQSAGFPWGSATTALCSSWCSLLLKVGPALQYALCSSRRACFSICTLPFK